MRSYLSSKTVLFHKQDFFYSFYFFIRRLNTNLSRRHQHNGSNYGGNEALNEMPRSRLGCRSDIDRRHSKHRRPQTSKQSHLRFTCNPRRLDDFVYSRDRVSCRLQPYQIKHLVDFDLRRSYRPARSLGNNYLRNLSSLMLSFFVLIPYSKSQPK